MTTSEAPARSGAHPADHLPHLPEPDFSRPLLEVSPEHRARLLHILGVMYGAAVAEEQYPELERLLRVYHAHKPPALAVHDAEFVPAERFSQQDVVLITYGDLLTAPGRRPLQVLAAFLRRFMKGAINTVHILPFFPYSSDRGFSIIDYEEVDPRLGSWEDIADLAGEFRLMFDGVFNHASAKSRWFQNFLNGRPGYEDFFVAFSTRDAISADYLRLILRPRTSDLLTPFRTINGTRYVWTTFSADQVDLNFRNPRVLLRVVEILLQYVQRGADLVRLDAVTYIWRELGTSCAHLRETHALVQLFRAILDVVSPRVALITETNVPHVDNISYFGNGADEAQMVYNFALPPLVLHTFHTGSCETLASWARTLVPISDTATYFNFLSSHDGIGLLGARGILSEDQVAALVDRTVDHGGFVSYRSNGDGTQSPYELNITWYSALNRDGGGEPQALQVARFLAARAIALALRGVPGIYLPTLFGARNDTEAVLGGAEKRSINRRTYDEASLMRLLDDRGSWVAQVARGMRRLIRRRIEQPAFHPNATQEVLDLGPGVFALVRERPGVQKLLALTNVTADTVRVQVPIEALGGARLWRDVLSKARYQFDGGTLSVRLKPYGVAWLTATPD
ncbi:MAG TPA: alpha-amylase family glycosyl hydrolase, partial [Luteitalea sp.]|nr:alpha-amylase family glycosyl hydrolase [Luteitalea sp.]